ncbi:PTS sugar transporter subunit IIA [Shigella flexneri]
MSAPSIPATKARLAQLDSRACRQLLNQAMACRTSLEVGAPARPVPDQPAGCAADYPYAVFRSITTGAARGGHQGDDRDRAARRRCRYPRKLEADLWAREAVFSTGLGFSFAIPHSKSGHIEQSTISVARLPAR